MLYDKYFNLYLPIKFKNDLTYNIIHRKQIKPLEYYLRMNCWYFPQNLSDIRCGLKLEQCVQYTSRKSSL